MSGGAKIIRVFPRRVRATTPCDTLCRFDAPGWFDEADEVHVSVTWTWDLPRAEMLAKQWEKVAPVKIGGPATGMRGEDFTPGMYLKNGYTITSRGCPNQCWFCSVWRREGGDVRELPIQAGWNILDDNILACSDAHIRSVFAMLETQTRKPEFTGGLEAKRLQPWHAEEMKRIKTKQAFFAYDTPDDYEPLVEAGKIMRNAGFTTASHSLRCYVLCGWKHDTTAKADDRMMQAIDAGFVPMGMPIRDERGKITPEWAKFARQWTRVAIIQSRIAERGRVK